jgi:hypothetical protein
MITFFTTPKPFRGQLAVTQRNALNSWKLLHPDAEVIVFGDEDGAAAACRELSLRHEPEIQRNDRGTPYLNALFDRAQHLAKHDLLCFLNCDILLMEDFRNAVSAAALAYPRFLMVGRRWDVRIEAPLDFSLADWGQRVRALALETNRQRPPQWIDYFAFSRGLFHGQILPFAVGRPGYDNWLIWKTRSLKVPVIDASEVMVAAHQNHDYSHHLDGEKGFWGGPETKANEKLLGPWWRFNTIEDATHRLTPRGLRRSFRHWPVLCSRAIGVTRSAIWFGLLGLTRPVRHRLGLRQGRNEEGRIVPRP